MPFFDSGGGTVVADFNPAWVATRRGAFSAAEVLDLLSDHGAVSIASVPDAAELLLGVIEALEGPSQLVSHFQGQIRRASRTSSIRASEEWHTDAIFSANAERFTGLVSLSASGATSTDFISTQDLAQEMVGALGHHARALMTQHTASAVRKFAAANHGGAMQVAEQETQVSLIEGGVEGPEYCRYSPLTAVGILCVVHGPECPVSPVVTEVWHACIKNCAQYRHCWTASGQFLVWDNERVMHRANLSAEGHRTLFRARFGRAAPGA